MMNKDELKKIVEEAKAQTIVSYANAYDFEPRWNKRDTIIYTVISLGLLAMTIGAIV